MNRKRTPIDRKLLTLLSVVGGALLLALAIAPLRMAARSAGAAEPLAVAALQAPADTNLTGHYVGTVAVTSPVQLGVLDLAIDLTSQGATFSGQVSEERTLIVAGAPAVQGSITGSIGGITPTLRLESASFPDTVANQAVTRRFRLEGEVLDGGRLLQGVYTEELTGYLPEPLIIKGRFLLSRPGAGDSGPGIPIITLQPDDSSVFVNRSTPIRLRFRDENGQPVGGMGVNLTTDLGSVVPARVTTNAAGEASATFNAGGAFGVATITATADNGYTTNAQVQVTPPIIVTVAAAADLLATGDGQTQVTVTVTDDNNQPIGNGQVTFSATLGAMNPTTATTDAGGRATAAFRAGQQPGLALITATYLGVEGHANVRLETPRVAGVTLVVAPPQVLLGQQATATATVQDQFGRPLAGELVVFFGTLGTVSPDSALSDANGRASATFRAGNSAGVANVRAIAGSHLGEAAVRVLDPAAMALLSISPNRGPATGGTAVTLQGQNFKAGASVLFNSTPCANVVFVTAGQLTCVTPAHPPATVNVQVDNGDGQSSTLSDSFTFEDDAEPETYRINLPILIR